jgi:hypothetical protein
VSQALAARALVKFLGKIGVVIDEGVDGVIARLMPDGVGMSDEDEKLVAEYIAQQRAERARAMARATQDYRRKEDAYVAAVARREKLHSQYLAAEKDLQGLDETTVGIDLLSAVYLDAKSDYENAKADAQLKNFQAHAALDYFNALMEQAINWGDFENK